jgi:hypothetical protein
LLAAGKTKVNVMAENCFVVMAIGTQGSGAETTTADQLRDAFDNVIKAALLKARPGIAVERADDCAAPGTITTDILTHLMFDDFVVADITHSNPNVFYELGIRHACRPGTVLIRNKNAKERAPFDISHQRYIEYECTPKGVSDLADRFIESFKWYDKNPATPDNQLLQLARLIKFNFPQYGDGKQERFADFMGDLLTLMLQSPDTLELMGNGAATEDQKRTAMFRLFGEHPEIAKNMMRLAVSMSA